MPDVNHSYKHNTIYVCTVYSSITVSICKLQRQHMTVCMYVCIYTVILWSDFSRIGSYKNTRHSIYSNACILFTSC